MKTRINDGIRRTKDRVCEVCKKIISSPTNRQKYHKECKVELIDKRKKKMCEYNKKYREKSKERRLQRLRDLRIKDYYKHKDKRNKTSKNYYKNNKEKALKYNRSNKWKADIIRETHRNFKKDKKCSICGITKNLEFHHFIYKSPVERKHITTLCKCCHSIIHRKVYKYVPKE
ncbi:MAG TPA: hypothetical protein VMZ91_13980 [Candidatus Paceibacterota bacterium]|nr:hypothetical protein [Candidatus Paceibacterota bacterium]